MTQTRVHDVDDVVEYMVNIYPGVFSMATLGRILFYAQRGAILENKVPLFKNNLYNTRDGNWSTCYSKSMLRLIEEGKVDIYELTSPLGFGDAKHVLADPLAKACIDHVVGHHLHHGAEYVQAAFNCCPEIKSLRSLNCIDVMSPDLLTYMLMGGSHG